MTKVEGPGGEAPETNSYGYEMSKAQTKNPWERSQGLAGEVRV